MQNGVLKTKTFTQEDVDAFYKVDDKTGPKQSSSTGVLSQAEYDSIPDNDGPPGTALTAITKKAQDARAAWFTKFGDTHYTSGKKKPYSVYLSSKGMTLDKDNKIIPTPNPYADVDVSNIRG